MAHKAKLEIDGKKYQVIKCDYEIEQPVDKDTGIPTAAPKGGKIDITIVSLDDDDLLFHKWMLNKVEQKDGKLVFEVVDRGEFSPKTVKFKDSYCIKMKETFDAHDDKKQMLMSLTIKAMEMEFGGDDNPLSLFSWAAGKLLGNPLVGKLLDRAAKEVKELDAFNKLGGKMVNKL